MALFLAGAESAFQGAAQAQGGIVFTNNMLTLDNGVIHREVLLDDEGMLETRAYRLAGSDEKFIIPKADEFAFSLDAKPMTGKSGWAYVSHEIAESGQGRSVTLNLEQVGGDLQLGVTYVIYPDLPLIRKRIAFTNTGASDLKIESLDIESLKFNGGGVGTRCWIMNDYARQKHLGQFIGDWYDPLVVVHHTQGRRGMFVGNEAPGVMKRTSAFLKPSVVAVGLTHIKENFGFRQWIEPGETWESTWVFSGLYADSDDPSAVLNTAVNDFVRRHMGCRIFQVDPKPVFVYNTWAPFKHDINEEMIRELADAAAECGIEEFVIDDGWQESYGDWGVHQEKFPNGLKPVFDYIKSKGMKPGVWISLCSAETKSNVYKDHPEWWVRKADGAPINLHSDKDEMYGWDSRSMCMTTGWKDYIRDVILNMVNEYGLEYIKGDFAAVTGAYTSDKTRSGCHASDHTHKDRNESMLEMYQATWELFDELHEAAPNLFIDCTFETMGALHLIDFDMCKHADGNWLSNFFDPAPLGALKVRRLAWSRSPVIPATSMVIGNQGLDDPNFMLSMKSLAGALPIVLGDPRQLTTEQRKEIRDMADWLKAMEKEYDFMSFRQDLPGFGEPQDGFWDGFQRINTETKAGGIVGVFKQNAKADERWVTVNYLDAEANYIVVQAASGTVVAEGTGADLENDGFKVVLKEDSAGELYGIVRK